MTTLPIELLMLAGSVGVLLVAIVVHAAAAVGQNGLAAQAGNRDGLPEPSPFVARAKRCVNNHIENLVMFAPLALIAAQQNILDQSTALAAMLFFGGRLAHAILYLLGVPWLRAGAFAVGLTGIAMMALSVLGVI
jgi:uncharacterized MAPEG superfamily protein